MASKSDVGAELQRLAGIMERLRAKDGCPWDREQDLRSLRPYLVEETYEVLDEMDRVAYGGPWAPLCEELGDLLFQIVFHAQLASELGEFTLADVCRAISDKLERRHPHVFGAAERVKDAEQVLHNWAKLKAEEKKQKKGSEGSVLDGVPSGAPALQRAERLTEKASRIGFDWPSLKDVRAKLDEELAELDEALVGKDRDALEHELGDVLFSLANIARFIQTPPEDALRQANKRFTRRFQYIEQKLKERGVPFGAATLEQMDALWVEAKVLEKGEAGPPRPLLPAPSRLATIELAVHDWLEETALWDALAPHLGWARTDQGTSARYGDGRSELILHKDGAAAAGLSLTLRVASPDALERLAEALAGSRARDVDVQPGRVQFRDPAGVRWTVSAA